MTQTTNAALAIHLVLCLALAGCGSTGLPSKTVYGTVACGKEKVPSGRVVFVPIEGTPGPNTAATIVDGQYRVASRGGVPVGKHRVMVDTRKKTGRKVQGYNGREATMVDEEVRMGTALYAGNQSPLVLEITPSFDGRYDIAIPDSH